MPERIIIFGAGGFGREVLQLTRDSERAGGGQTCVGFLVDEGVSAPDKLNGAPVHRGPAALRSEGWDAVVIGVGAPAARKKIAERLQGALPGLRFATVVHPRAAVGDTVRLGPGCVIAVGTVLTTEIVLGAHVQVNLNATIGHDCEIGDFVTIDPGVTISGNCHLEEGCDLGSGANLLPNVRVGAWAVLGAGAVVLRDIPADCTAVGVPAVPIKRN
jgi:sugar O-acyltransferase (sialic acid O-acetyltransferase NeuD family)